jgi:glyoxalase family protein
LHELNVERLMRLDGIHHVTGITGDGQRCLDFYAGILGLAFVGRARDFEAPDSHLIRLGEEPGRPGGVLSFIEAPGIGRGRAGNGIVHALSWIVRSPAAISYWADRLADGGIDVTEIEANGRGPRLRFADPEGIEHELTADPSGPDGLSLGSAAIPSQHAIVGLAGVRAYGRASVPSADILAGRLGFRVTGKDSYVVEGEQRSSTFHFDSPPPERGRIGTGTIHHVAWAGDAELPAWRQRVIGMGCRATPVIDRGHCRSIYFREPSGVLFEIATSGDEDGSHESVPATEGRLLSPAVDPRVRAALVG